jgi:hypothetical protein
MAPHPRRLPRPALRLPDQAPVGRSRRPSPCSHPRPPNCARPRTIAPRPSVAQWLPPSPPARPGLFDLSSDPGEQKNLLLENPAEAERIAAQLAAAKASPRTRP